ncbi:hypothetical protein E1286_18855 [Nonomuraea terrae]|uniref:Uncharacterized protein n=1 Tax=Nonomuraea terrae TaxID=2530383 RepID=A0A4R4YPI8_9ACTN|nr:hypothetical protein [Nonomuraea terrae]TDD47026.1 hypothetical protein E1286_18855 [Nonomuraea terrae]
MAHVVDVGLTKERSREKNAVIVGQQRWMLTLFADLAEAAGVAEPRLVADRIMLLHEGALVTAGMGIVDDAFTHAAASAAALLA